RAARRATTTRRHHAIHDVRPRRQEHRDRRAPDQGAGGGDGALQRGDEEGRRAARGRRAPTQLEGGAHHVLASDAQRDGRAVPRQGAGLRLLDDPGEVEERGGRMGQARALRGRRGGRDSSGVRGVGLSGRGPASRGRRARAVDARGVAEEAWSLSSSSRASSRRRAAPSLAGMEAGWTQSLDRLGVHLAGTADREIVATRVVDAPREHVFEMFTDRQHVARWWGPKGFTSTIEIAGPERLVYTHTGGAQFQATATFTSYGEKTVLAMRMLFESSRERDRVVKKFGAIEGLSQTLDRLEV